MALHVRCRAGADAGRRNRQSLANSAKAVIGTWEFSNADRDKMCTADVQEPIPSPVGFKIEFDKNCAKLFPLVNDVVGWNYPENDLLRLLDAQGKSLVEFSEVEDGILRGADARRRRVVPAERRRRRSAAEAAGASGRRLGDGARQRRAVVPR